MTQVLIAVVMGLILVPVGAATGTLITLLFALAWEQTTAISLHAVLGFVAFGTMIGSLFAFPVTVIALPTAYALLRWRRTLSVQKLVIVGFVASAVSIWFFTQKARYDGGLWILFVAATVSGLVVGFAFAKVMQRWQGQDWAAHTAKLTQ